MEDEAIEVVDEGMPDPHTLTEEEKQILNAANKSKPLWQENRKSYTRESMLQQFVPEKEIDLSLLVEDYMPMFDIFCQQSIGPFGKESAYKEVSFKKMQDIPSKPFQKKD